MTTTVIYSFGHGQPTLTAMPMFICLRPAGRLFHSFVPAAMKYQVSEVAVGLPDDTGPRVSRIPLSGADDDLHQRPANSSQVSQSHARQ